MSILLSNINSPQTRADNPPIIAQTPPPTTGPRALQYPIGTMWIDSSTDTVYMLTSFSGGTATWVDTVPAGAGVFTSLSVTPGPVDLEGTIHIEGIDNVAEVIRLRENGGVAGTIEIASLQGTGSDSIKIQSVSGGIQVTTDAAAGDIAITSTLGSIPISSGENIAGAIELLVDGGAASTLIVTNASGTGADSVQVNSDLGGVEVLTAAAGKDITISSTLGSIGIVAGEDILTAIVIQADGATNSGLLIENTSGTGSGASTTSAIGVLATDGAVYVESQGAFSGAVVLDASDAAGGVLVNSGSNGTSLTSTGDISAVTTLGDVDLTADAGDVNIEATLGALNFTAGGGLSWNVTGGINLDATLDSHFTVTGAGQNLLLSSVGGSVLVDATEAAVDAIDINASAGGIEIDAVDASHFTVTGAAKDLLLSSSGGSVNMIASEAAVNAIRIQASNAAGGIDIDSGTGGVTLDSTGAFSIDGAAASNVTTTGAGIDLTLSSALGSVIVTASEAVVNAVQITASDAAGGLDLNAGTGGITIDSTGAFSIDGAAASNVTTTGAGIDLTLSSALGSVIITASEAAVNAVQLTASDAAGGLDLNAGTGGITLDSTGAISIDAAAASNLTVTGAFDLTVNSTAGSVVVNGAEAAADAIQLNASNGGIAITTAAASDVVLTGGNFEAASATKGMILGSGTKVIDGAGSPNASVTAPKGSLYLSTNGSGVADRLFINTDGATAWTAITTVA